MYQKVYIDIVFVTNLLMDYFLLRLVGMLLRCRTGRRRCMAAAVTGALFSCFVLYIPVKTGNRWHPYFCMGSALLEWYGSVMGFVRDRFWQKHFLCCI